jgi:CRISPR-associated endonuclease Cas1
MAAPKTVPQLSPSHNSIVPRHGVVSLFGYGIQVRVDRGHLLLDDGIGADRRHFRLPRVGHGLSRLVVIGSDGFISLAALRWLADQGASFVMLEREGEVLATTGPVRPSDVRLRRAQALAHQTGAALEIATQLIEAKLSGQEAVVRDKLKDSATADTIARFRARLPAAESVELVRTLEAHAAGAYWGAWRDVPVLFPKADQRRVPAHWKFFWTRASPLTGSPRLAVTPPGAILNYCYTLLESEARLATAVLGLDPGLGVLHVDTPNRDSLACDIMEAARPAVDAWLLDWITREPLRRSDFFEQRSGNCRLMGAFAAKLSETAPVWGRLVAPWAEYAARTLWATASHSKSHRTPTPATRLTQQNRREAKGRPALPPVKLPKPNVICRGCGEHVRRGAHLCSKCAVTATRENFAAGRKSAQQPEFLAKRASTMQGHKQAIQNWNPLELPTWLDEECYVQKIQPKLRAIRVREIATALKVSQPYAAFIRSGRRRPHPRHWLALAELVRIALKL